MFFQEKIYNLSVLNEIPNELETFWLNNNLSVKLPLDKALLLFDKNQLIAAVSYYKNIVKGICIHPDYKGYNISGTLLSWVLHELEQKKLFNILIYTKPENKSIFSDLGFNTIIEVTNSILMERGKPDFNGFLSYLSTLYNIYKTKNNGCIIVNANPMTNGHLYLIENASQSVESLFIFVLKEDRSLFPFQIRYTIVKNSVSHLKNCIVLPSSQYIISSATFPDYFLKGLNKEAVYAELDIKLFATKIAPILNITKRFVGTEPYCEVTNTYNKAMEINLPSYNISLIQIERKAYEDSAISASTVRELIKNNDFEKIQKIVPKATYDFINSDEAKYIIDKIKHSDTRH